MKLINSNKVAILMATFNGGRYIQDQIKSILNQTYTNWTLYIRDDGSTDDTCSIIDGFCDDNVNIVKISDSKKSLGCRDNFCELLDIVESQYYMFSDQDDIWFPNKIELSLTALQKLEADAQSTPILVHTDAVKTDKDMNVLAGSLQRETRINPELFKKVQYAAMLCFTQGATMLFNHQVKAITLPIDKNISMHDKWIALQVLKSNGIIFSLNIPTLYYRRHANNASGAIVRKRGSIRNMVQYICEKIKSNLQLAKEYKAVSGGSYFSCIYYRIGTFVKRYSNNS